MKNLYLFLLTLWLICHCGYLNGQENYKKSTEYNRAKEFLGYQLSLNHNIQGWPEPRSDWFIIIIDGEKKDCFFEISGITVWNEFIMLRVREAKYLSKPNGVGLMYVLEYPKYLNINCKDTLNLIKHKKYSRIRYKNIEIGYGGSEKVSIIDSLYTHLIKLKSILEKQDLDHNLLLESFKKNYTDTSNNKILNEDQRRFIVQAKAATEEKKYYKAIELYENAINLNPYAYPMVYKEIALLESKNGNYFVAIYNMKKYIFLVNGSEEARSAQDKIYEWELKLDL